MELLPKQSVVSISELMNAELPEPGMRDAESEEGGSGTDPPVRSIDRAARLLKAIAAHPFEGAMLVDLAHEIGLGKATTHRLLAALTDVGFVFQDLATRRYRLGSAVVELAGHARTQEIAAVCRPVLERIAAETGDTVYLSAPEGPAAVCLARAVGAFPIRTLTLAVGDRRPLGVGAGSLALLAAMEDKLVTKALERNKDWYPAFHGFAEEIIQELVKRTRREGFAYNEGRLVPGMGAVAVAVLDDNKRAVAALSVAAISERISGERMEMLVGLLQREATALSSHFARARN